MPAIDASRTKSESPSSPQFSSGLGPNAGRFRESAVCAPRIHARRSEPERHPVTRRPSMTEHGFQAGHHCSQYRPAWRTIVCRRPTMNFSGLRPLLQRSHSDNHVRAPFASNWGRTLRFEQKSSPTPIPHFPPSSIRIVRGLRNTKVQDPARTSHTSEGCPEQNPHRGRILRVHIYST